MAKNNQFSWKTKNKSPMPIIELTLKMFFE